MERWPEAAGELTEAVRLDPGDSDALSHLAYCELRLARPGPARAHAQAAVGINPGDRLAGQVLGILRGGGSE
jgi:hypothetical protein